MSRHPLIHALLALTLCCGLSLSWALPSPKDIEAALNAGQTAQAESMLREVLKDPAIKRALLFTRTKHGANKVATLLERNGVTAEAIHGNKSQNQRERVLAAFRNGAIKTLVATDIAARGIDVDGVSHVFNFDLPNVPESYVHRIGRTARAGAEGTAISLCSSDEIAYLRDIQRLIKMEIPASGTVPAATRPQHRQQQHRNGGRPQHHSRGQQQRNGQRRGQPGDATELVHADMQPP